MSDSNRCASILVVEDDRDIRNCLSEALEAEGYNVYAVENGREGLAKLATISRPCIVLLDLMMPVMNGIEFMGALHSDDVLATIPVVIVSAFTEIAREAKGAVGLVKKPIDLERLLEFVHRYCRE